MRNFITSVRVYWFLIRHVDWAIRYNRATEAEKWAIADFWVTTGELPRRWHTEVRLPSWTQGNADETR